MSAELGMGIEWCEMPPPAKPFFVALPFRSHHHSVLRRRLRQRPQHQTLHARRSTSDVGPRPCSAVPPVAEVKNQRGDTAAMFGISYLHRSYQKKLFIHTQPPPAGVDPSTHSPTSSCGLGGEHFASWATQWGTHTPRWSRDMNPTSHPTSPGSCAAGREPRPRHRPSLWATWEGKQGGGRGQVEGSTGGTILNPET